jgi:hypothetical protein
MRRCPVRLEVDSNHPVSRRIIAWGHGSFAYDIGNLLQQPTRAFQFRRRLDAGYNSIARNKRRPNCLMIENRESAPCRAGDGVDWRSRGWLRRASSCPVRHSAPLGRGGSGMRALAQNRQGGHNGQRRSCAAGCQRLVVGNKDNSQEKGRVGT